MARRPTITDLAHAAGVGTATVDRVLNGRGNVREATVERVAEAAARIGYHGASLLRHRARAPRPRLRIGFVFPKQTQAFYANFAAQVQASVVDRADIDGQCVIRYPDAATPESYEATLRSLGESVDVIGAVAINHPKVTQAVEALAARGVRTLTLLNDCAQGVRSAYLGTNNMKVGRIAAWMLATQIREAGRIAIFVGGHHWHGHHLREAGFHAYMREMAPQHELLPTFVNLDTRQMTYEATASLLAREPNLRGMYVAGGGMEGAIAALRELRPPGKISLVVNEITDESRAALIDRYVCLAIATPLRDLCADAVGIMARLHLSNEWPAQSQMFYEPLLFSPESV
ncbi:LacI family DNA-binding transcriptional regulator [Oceanicola sp. 502str15]|uniref:LacI family DNA-binding transcriptional regulator n=1 Tax=Oceanicola sp. 502str15 TaxID=2696061 RepID=UPI002094D356|nr:LacI family DNA-binding transcriptional regulator [Oceanicola sp. 502str15]MCO6385380.1 substrate-binding domain-containing protein [Oceanicola sp. 502str15]